jgi:gamma-glutamyltranspeptidase/glutathione hydrolase
VRDFQKPNRSLVVSREAMAATSHPSATLAAMNILAAGGNALDAAIAACAVQCVVEPGSTGIGGDCFALLSKGGSGEVIAYNGSGRAPAAATADWFAQKGISEIERQSPHAVTVPGAVDAWLTLHADHGRLPFDRILAPAIRFAEEGYAISPRVARDWNKEIELLSVDPSARRILLPGGRPPRLGEVHRQPELGATLRGIAENGRGGFYSGPVAEDMVSHLHSLGGLHTLDDFATACGEYVEPVRTGFRGYDVHECPPNGQGIIALMILNILSRFGPASGGPASADRLHLEIEATRLAYAARDALLADPAKAFVPVDDMLSDAMADRLAGMIDLKRAIPDLPSFAGPQHRDTVYLCVVDKDRNAVSFINSVYDTFGTGFVAPRSGVVFHNRGECFSLDPAHPNVIEPGKRPLHTIIPGMLTRNGRVEMPFGVMGGFYQAMGHATLVSSVIDYGLDVQAAMELPRVMPTPTGEVEAESTLDSGVAAELEARGFRIFYSGRPIGGAQAIAIDWQNGTLQGGSEPRKDGCAIGL